MKKKLSYWIQAARPRTLPLSVSGVVLAGLLVQSQQNLNLFLFGMAIIIVMIFQIISNFANDYGDSLKHTDDHRSDRMVSSGRIRPREIKMAIAFLSAISFLLSCYIIDAAFSTSEEVWTFVGFVVLAILAALGYTLGKRPYGYLGLGDVFVFIFFGLFSVGGGFYLFSQYWDSYILLPAVSIGCLSVSVLNLNNMRDIHTDKVSKKQTLVVLMGLERAKVYHTLLISVAFVAGTLYKISNLKGVGQFIFLLLLFGFVKHLKRIMKHQKFDEFDGEFKFLGSSTLQFAILYSVSEIEFIAYLLPF